MGLYMKTLSSLSVKLLRVPHRPTSLTLHTTAATHDSMISRTRDNGHEKADVGGIENFHHPSKLEKRVMVFAKVYPTIEAIPETVSYASVQKAKDITRVYVNIGMVLLTVVMCAFTIRLGRKAAKRGERHIDGQPWLAGMEQKGLDQMKAVKDAKESK